MFISLKERWLLLFCWRLISSITLILSPLFRRALDRETSWFGRSALMTELLVTVFLASSLFFSFLRVCFRTRIVRDVYLILFESNAFTKKFFWTGEMIYAHDGIPINGVYSIISFFSFLRVFFRTRIVSDVYLILFESNAFTKKFLQTWQHNNITF